MPDLVVEVISPGRVRMDRVKKKSEYAQAGIPEYCIIDPESQIVEVYLLQGNRYQLSQSLRVGDTLTSAQFPGWSIELAALFAPT